MCKRFSLLKTLYNSNLRTMMTKPLLAAFDFDHTIVDANTDIVVRKLLPDDKLPESIKGLYHTHGWTAYMGKIFELLHENAINESQINEAIENVAAVPGIEKLLTTLHSNNCDIIIISDSNSIFIERWLKHKKLDRLISRTFTNPAKYDANGLLKIEPFHFQDWCKLSEKNLCKGHILDNYIEESSKNGISYQKIAYVGDGRNDLCPMLRLSANDLAFPRIGYVLMKILNDAEQNQTHELKAEKLPWNDATNILENLGKRVQALKSSCNSSVSESTFSPIL